MQNNELIQIMNVFAEMVESRNRITDGRLDKIKAYLKVIIDGMLERGVYAYELKKMDLDLLISSACLYDIGKLFISEIVLRKPVRLTKEEFDYIKAHTTEGETIIDKFASSTKGNELFFQYAKLFAGNHHELYNGLGYPRGLSKADIPLQGRIMAIIDVYDALISERPYKKPFESDDAFKIIMDGAGEQFDPLIVDVFLEVKDQLIKIG